MSISINFPIVLATGSLGYIESTSTIEDAISSNFRQLILTNWGERVMHASFGCNLIEFLFEQKNKNLKYNIAERIKNQTSQWMPFLKISKLYVLFSDEDKSVQENGFKIIAELIYGNKQIDLSVIFPNN